MIRIIRDFSISHDVEFDLNFDTSKNSGYAFPCTHTGEVILPLPPSAQANYERCKSGEIPTIKPPYVRELHKTTYNYAIGECYCGAEVELRPDSEGLCHCHCGACYTISGNSIRPRSEWE